jgi:hypothetical protein
MSKSDTARIDRGQELVGQGVEQAYTQADFGRFPASRLEQMNPSLRVNPATAQSAFLGNMANPFAGSFQLQRMPGAQYANYERMAPNVGGPLTAPQVPAGFVPAGTQPETIRVYPDGTPVEDEETTDDIDPSNINLDDSPFMQEINQERIDKGLPPFETFEEYLFSNLGGPGRLSNLYGGMAGIGGGIGMAEGGIASVQPQYMAGGGIMAALGGLGRGIGGAFTGAGGAIGNALQGIGGGVGKGIEALGGLAQQANENYQANQKKQEKRLEDMTREELIEYIKSGGKSPAGGNNLGGLKNLANMFTDSVMNRPTGGTAALGEMGDLSMLYAEGGDVEYPRMNGPISGPGTETSDDIPAMLSDGEFVVNAKAVRGIGRLEGAGKSKEEQRREGARMMYALQKAGEKAMRKA